VTRAVTATGAELSARFAAKVVRPLGCHFWVGGIADDAYGRFAVGGGRVVRAHRWAWEQVYGPVPDGLMVMHACETSCVNAVECLLLGTRRGPGADGPLRPAGRPGAMGLPDRRRARGPGPRDSGGAVRRVRPGRLAAAVAAGDPRPGQRVLF